MDNKKFIKMLSDKELNDYFYYIIDRLRMDNYYTASLNFGEKNDMVIELPKKDEWDNSDIIQARIISKTKNLQKYVYLNDFKFYMNTDYSLQNGNGDKYIKMLLLHQFGNDYI